MDVFILWFAFSIMAGVVAGNKGRSGIGFFFLSALLSPLIGLVAAWIAKPSATIEMEKAQYGQSSEFKRCPVCAETVRIAAIKCRYCGAEFEQKATPAPAKAPEPAPVDRELTLEEILAKESDAAKPNAGN
jgi:hypothetical protein